MRGGVELPPLVNDVPEGPWPTGKTAARRVGLDSRALLEEFERLTRVHGLHARYPRAVLTEFFPDRLPEVLGAIVREGPALSAERALRAVDTFSSMQVAADRRRCAGPPMQGSVDGLRDRYRRVFHTLVDLRARGLEHPELAQWIAVPDVRTPRMAARRTLTDGPSLQAVRPALGAIEAEIHERLGVTCRDDELEAIRDMSPTAILRAAAHKALRLRLVLLLLVVLGPRIGELAALRRSDYKHDHLGPAPDRRRGPALVIHPQKKGHDVESVKPLPIEFGAVIEGYLVYGDRYWETCRALGQSTEPRPADADCPLLLSHVRQYRGWDEHAIRVTVGGLRPAAVQRGVRPLIVREGVAEHLPVEQRQYVGYNPHSYRHTASQLAEWSGRWWNDHFGETALSFAEPAWYAASLLDHAPAEERLRALYGDRSSPLYRELLAGRAIDGNWRQVATDLGARRTLDLDRWREVVRLRVAAELQREYKRKQQRVVLASATDPEQHGTTRDLVRAAATAQTLAQDVDELADRLDELDELLERLANDRSTWLVVPDDAEVPPMVDLEEEQQRVRQDLRSEPVPNGNQKLEWRRRWLITSEFADIFGVDRATVARWCEGRSLPRDPARRPWEASAIPIDNSLGLRYRRIAVGHLKPSFVRGDAIRRALDDVLSDWPRTKGWIVQGQPSWRCEAPLEVSGFENAS